MTAADPDWLARNDAYLAAALAQLRHRLNAVEPPPAPAPEAVPDNPVRNPLGLFGLRSGQGRKPPAEASDVVLLTAPAPGSPAIEARRLAEALAESATGDPPPALVELGHRLGLLPFEQDLLLLAVAAELDPRIGQPTVALAVAALPEPAWEAFAPDRPLRHWRLLEIDRRDGRPLTASPLRVDERILHHAKGLAHLDAQLAAVITPAVPAPGVLPPSQQAAAARLAAAFDPARAGVAVLRGTDRAGQRDVAAAAAAAAGLALHRLDAAALPHAADELELLARLWHRETLLAPLALLIEAHELDRGEGAARLARFVGRSGGPLLIASRDGVTLGVEVAVDCDIARPTTAEQATAWRAALGDGAKADALARRLAGRFDIDRHAIAAAARAGGDPAEAAFAERLSRAVVAGTRTALAGLAERIDVKARFDDLVLPPGPIAQLRQLVAQVEQRAVVMGDWGFADGMNRGLGVSALFAGPSGTGKTMAAEVVAQALGLDLYRIDLAAVVSKYIGETEKNLGALFDAAESGGAILLFDEADALFGKRSEVKESHDRYANIEVDYLLQRIESFRGLAVLTTNVKTALDPAFTRRLRFVVEFPYPGTAERRRIWEHALPSAVPAEALDLDALARLDLTGAAIHAVALNAAFLAAERNAKVSTALLIEAARAEFRKLDRPINEADFRNFRVAAGP